ncbi:glycosyltransferase family 2 protein [Algoriphagus formosus]|uniref:glycosyltransferase family 2 protein n=1 Tax=Algoriphagus formosus TaxID=2007308 RepID=UPI003F7291FD
MEYLGEAKPVNLVDPLVSVCVPTFQHAKYIKQCLETIIGQKTSFSYEILIGEDASTDGTREICKSIAEKNQDKVRLFLRDANEKWTRDGKKVGRKNHLELYQSARGKFICICDGDDYWMNENKLQYQVDLMEEHPDASICIGKTYKENTQPPFSPKWPDQVKILSDKDLTLTFYMGHVSSWMLRNHMHEFVKNKAAQTCPGLDLVLFNFYKRKGCVIQCPQMLSFYRFNKQGSLRKLSKVERRKKLWKVNWLLFKYIHKSPYVYLRSLVYYYKRGLINAAINKKE